MVQDLRLLRRLYIFDFVNEYKGPRTLRVMIMRSIKGTLGCTDRAWVSQVAQPADFEEYERAWQATHAECLRKVGSFNYIW